MGKRLLQTLTARAAYVQQTDPTPLRCLRIARYALQEYLLPEQIAIVVSRAVGEIAHALVGRLRLRGIDHYAELGFAFHEVAQDVVAKQQVAVGNNGVGLQTVRCARKRREFAGLGIAFVDDQLDAGRVDRIGTIAADHGNVVDALFLEAVHQPAQQRLAGHRQHHLGPIGRHRFETGAAACGQHKRGARRARGRQIQALGVRILVGVLQAEDFIDGRNAVLDLDQRLGLIDLFGHGLHRRGGRADQMIRPDHRADARLAEHFGRRAVVLGRHDHQRPATGPFARELENLVRARQFAVDQDGIRAGAAIGFGAAQRFVHAPSGDQRFDARHDGEIGIRLGILARLDLAAKFVDVGQRLRFAVDEAVGLGKLFVFDAHAGHAALFELADQAAHVVEVTVAGIAIEQDRQLAGVGHELEHVDHLGPAHFIVVAHAKLRRDRQARSPDGFEAGLAHDARRQAVVGFHQEFGFIA